MSGKALTWAKKIPGLTQGEQSLLTIIASSFNDKKGCCYPKIKQLAAWCSCSERTIKRHIKSLISKNIVQKEDVRNQLGHRVTSKYTLNFDLNLDSLSDNLSCGKLQPLSDNLSTLSDNLSRPKCQNVTKDYIINKNTNKKKTKEISLVDKNKQQDEQQKVEAMIAIKFEELRKIYDDSYDIQSAKKLHKKLCLENLRHQFAQNLVVARKRQKIDSDNLRKAGEFVPAPCSLKKWLEGNRWLDIIKPIGLKKKVNPYVKCKQCGEEYLKGHYCGRCAELSKPRVMCV